MKNHYFWPKNKQTAAGKKKAVQKIRKKFRSVSSSWRKGWQKQTTLSQHFFWFLSFFFFFNENVWEIFFKNEQSKETWQTTHTRYPKHPHRRACDLPMFVSHEKKTHIQRTDIRMKGSNILMWHIESLCWNDMVRLSWHLLYSFLEKSDIFLLYCTYISLLYSLMLDSNDFQTNVRCQFIF